MARLSVVAAVLILLCAVASGEADHHFRSSFDEENPIRLVSDSIRDLESSVLRLIGDTRHAHSFASFAHRYGKSYKTVDEIKLRFEIFSENLKLIRSTNRKGLPYTLAVNQFADWTWEEFRRHRLGAAQNCSATLKGNHKLTDVILPETKDWREDGIVSPIKDQGHCGSCWTFSTTGALEAAYAQAFGKGISLSEQQLVDCAGAFNNFGCHGGLPSQAFEYIKYNGGLDTEEAYPYTGLDGTCKFSSENIGVQVLDSVNITLDVNHAVLAVGYGVEDGVAYWLIKNSWGENWGDNGYFKMELGKNMCGVATCSSYPVVA
ncbi:thiol protease aleurain-like isoform X2 [Vitis vinifera]|uniref:thiol protease aleurain-like isoform X2 n=1 Tax=Vitis vinifera TaxID=29760 RepID=UPI00023B2E52|nr:thiol protease aleurain-like isoform X2 [Vitis vinifera]|eukprot:XP_003633102.1 PREDICTED: thiol protease aleurain-like isoform X2 [Vitis vinifera]